MLRELLVSRINHNGWRCNAIRFLFDQVLRNQNLLYLWTAKKKAPSILAKASGCE